MYVSHICEDVSILAPVCLPVIDDRDARELGQGIKRLLLGYVLLELNVDALSMRPHHRHADAGGRDFNVRVPPDLAGLLDQLHLLLIVTELHVHARIV